MARPFPSIRKPSAGWTGAVNYTLEDHIASPYPHPIYPRKDGVLPNDSITRHMTDAGAHRKYFLSTAELIFTKADYEANNVRDKTSITSPSVRESTLYPHLITATALRQILDGYNPSSGGGFSYNSLVKAIAGAPGAHTYTMCTSTDTPYAPSIALFVDLFDKFNAVVGILPDQSKPSAVPPTVLTSVFAPIDHTHEEYGAHGASHAEIWAAINAGGGGSGTGGSGGVIDGTLCTDVVTGEQCVTEIELHDGTNPNNQTSYTYTAQHNCLLFIQLKNAIIADNESASVPRDCILVKVGDNVVGTLTDNMQDLHNDLDNDNLRIPIKAGTTVTLVGDGETPIFDGASLTTDSKIVLSEFELTPLSMRVGMPDYGNGVDITSYVARTAVYTSKGYKAPSDGFVLFDCTPTYGNDKFTPASGYKYYAFGYVAGVAVAYAHISADSSIHNRNEDMVPVRKGDVIDWRVTKNISSDTNPIIATDLINAEGVSCTFFPLAGADTTTGEGPIEYPVFECAFTDTENNPFIGNVIPTTDDLTITPAKLEALCGRSDIDLNTASITLKVDVFKPQMTGANVVLDANGHAVVDKNYPFYRNEAIVYADADNSPAGYYNDYSRHLDVSVVNGSAKIAWTSVFAKAAASNSVRASFVLPALSTIASGSNVQRAEWDDFNNRYGGYIDHAADLGLANCYIRLTAVIDPNTKIVRQSKAGMFIDGQINVDDNGNVCKTLVTYDKWAENGNATDGYTYVYTVKTDCLLYMNVGLEINNSTQEEVVIKINGETLDTYTDTGMSTSGQLIDLCRILSLPLSKGTKVSFYTKATPVHNQATASGALPGGEEFIIKLIEFKMSTELNPAKFPSLAIRVCDVDCHEESTNASVLPAGSTCEYFTWTESQMRQVFGSAFDFDHARFDVSAVFYVGNSASDYDTADNKLQDDGILISPTSQGQQVRPSVTIDTVGGERIAKLALPGIDYFCSTVKSDTTDGFKLVTRTDGAHIGIGSSGNNLVSDFNTDYSKKVRMRLLLHVSDRRSETSHMYASTPDWDASKKTIINTGDRVPADGWIVVYPTQIASTGTVDILINNINVLKLSRATNGWQDTNGGTFPVSKGDTITWTGDTTVITPGVTFYPAKHTQLEVPDFNVPGSAGVIDGSIWKKADGTDESTTIKDGDTTSLADNGTLNSSTKTLTYQVKNDCYLYIKCDAGQDAIDVGLNAWTSDGTRIQVMVNGVEVGRLMDHTSGSGANANDRPAFGINVAAGSVVTVENNYNGDKKILFSTFGSSASISFTEFKLRATNVVMPMPDWNATPTKIIDTAATPPITIPTTGTTITSDGWLYCYGASSAGSSGDSPARVEVNGNEVMRISGSNTSSEKIGIARAGMLVPVSKGDKITTVGSITSMKFYPIKMHKIHSTSAIEVIAMSSRSDAPSWWKVYSNGWCEQGGLGTENLDTYLSIPFYSTDYSVTGTVQAGVSDSNGWITVIDETNTSEWKKTNTKFRFTVGNDTDGTAKARWRAEGWISDASLTAIKQGKVWNPAADSNAGAWEAPSQS